MSQFATGWVPRPEEVRAYVAHRARSGAPCAIGDARPDLKGFWPKLVLQGVYSVLLYEAEHALTGQYAAADHQLRGTCVGRGTYRAIQTTYWDALAERRLVGRIERVSYEPIYAGSRTTIAHGALGFEDGSNGVWAARWCYEMGVIPRGIYGPYDLTRDREDLAVQWGQPRTGVPQLVAEAGRGHECEAYYVPTAEALADVTAARYASAICSTHEQTPRRDENGECTYHGATAHCEAITGVYMRLSWDGRPESIYDHTGFVDQQSWGNVPSGPDALRMYRGQAAKLRPGAYGTSMRDMRARIVTGETWAFRLKEPFRAKTLQEAI